MTHLQAAGPVTRQRRFHPAWIVAAVAFVTLLGAAAFRAVPGVLVTPLHDEFGWSHGTIGLAVSVNLVLFGAFSPFAAALMDTFGIRKVVTTALLLVALGSGLTVWMSAAWQLVVLWGGSWSGSAPDRCRWPSSPPSRVDGS